MKPTRTQKSRYIKRKLLASIRVGAALCLLSFLAADTGAVPLALGPNQTTSSLALPVSQFQVGHRSSGSTSVDLEFDKPIYIATGEIVLTCAVTWGPMTWADAFGQLYSEGDYILDAKGDWLSLGRPEIAASPFGNIWLKIYVDEPLALYGVRYDWKIPELYFNQAALWVRSSTQPFQVGGSGSVPDDGTSLILLGGTLVGLFLVRKKV